MRHILYGIHSVFLLHRAAKLNNQHKYDEALDLLDQVRSDPLNMAKVTLFQADILHRKGDFRKACERYELFLSSRLEDVANSKDRNYLYLYANYYLFHAGRKAGNPRSFEVSREEVQLAAQDISLLTKSDFPP